MLYCNYGLGVLRSLAPTGGYVPRRDPLRPALAGCATAEINPLSLHAGGGYFYADFYGQVLHAIHSMRLESLTVSRLTAVFSRALYHGIIVAFALHERGIAVRWIAGADSKVSKTL